MFAASPVKTFTLRVSVLNKSVLRSYEKKSGKDTFLRENVCENFKDYEIVYMSVVVYGDVPVGKCTGTTCEDEFGFERCHAGGGDLDIGEKE